MFWRYWSASSISNLGSAVSSIALPLTAVLTLHAGSFAVGLIAAAGYAAWALISLPAGVIVHRLPLRATVVAMDLIRAAALISIPLAAWAGGLTVAQVAAVALLVGMADVVFDVANFTLLPEIVSREDLTSRNSLTSGSHAVTQLGGPSLGGALVQLIGAPVAILADVASYLASAALMRSLPRPAHRREPGEEAVPMRVLIGDGIRFVRRNQVMFPCVLWATTTNFVEGATLALSPLFLVRILHLPAAAVGAILTSSGIGALAGAALTPRVVRRLGSARACRYTGVLESLSGLLLPLAGPGAGVVLYALGLAGSDAGTVVGSIATRTHRQTASPPELLPRVMATVRFISWGVVPLGALGGGLAAAAFGIRPALWLFSGIGLLGPVWLWASPVRRLHDLADGTPPGRPVLDLGPS
jgi:predicted MFS family arabinose efflux permease